MTFDELQRYTKELNVLYVEDSLTIRKTITKMLDGLFMNLDVGKDGREGIGLYRDFHEQFEKNYDIVITDLEMPQMDGMELSKVLFDFDPKQEIIVLSSNNDFRRLVDLINLGVNKFVAKPVDKEQLYEVVYDVVQKIRKKRLEAEEQEELAEYNRILKEREAEYLRELEASNKELHEFMDALNASAIVSKTDGEGTITFVNDKFCRISGYSEEELLGENHRIVNSGQMSRSFYMKLWHTIVDKKTYSGLLINRSKDGGLYYVQTTIKPILDLEGEVKEYISVAYDMTQMMESLSNEQKARRAKDEFFVNISHEMRTPLNAINGFISLLKKRVKADPKALEMAGIVEESARELQDLIESVMDIKKLKDKTLKLMETEFNPIDVLRKCHAKYMEKADSKKHIAFHYTIDDDTPKKLFGDVKRLVQAISAILDNAVKFTPEGGRIESHVFYEPTSQKLVCQVKDSGIGIAPEDHAKIFDMQQADGSLQRTHEGAGLGLVIAYEIAKLMNGRISFSSEVGKGSTFMLEFSLKAP